MTLHRDFPCFTVEEFDQYFWKLDQACRAYPCYDCSYQYQQKMLSEGRCRHPQASVTKAGRMYLANIWRNDAYFVHLPREDRHHVRTDQRDCDSGHGGAGRP